MPLPFIIGGIAAVAGIAGAGGAIRGTVKMKEANDTVKSAERRHDLNAKKLNAKEEESNTAMDKLGKKELKILNSFDKFSDLFEKIKNKPTFADISIDGVNLPEYNPEKIKEVSVGAAVLLGGLGGAAIGTAGGFAAAGATTAAVMALGTASTGTAIASLSGVAATNATLAALGGGALAAGGGGMALGSAILGGATLGVGLLVGGVIFSVTGSKLSDKADEAWDEMKKAEKKINKIFAYLDELQTLAENYTHSLKAVDKVYTKHLDELDKLVNTRNKCDWVNYTEEEKLCVKNTVLLVQLLFNMCKVKLVLQSDKKNGMNTINSSEATEQLENAKKICISNSFKYKDNLYDVIVTLKNDNYFYSEEVFVDMLPINITKAEKIRDKINKNTPIILFKQVTSSRAKSIVNELENVSSLNISSVKSGKNQSAIYYADIK